MRSFTKGTRSATIGVASALALVLTVASYMAAYATTVGNLVLSPSPIGTVSTTAPGSRVVVTLTIEDLNGNAIPHGNAYLRFEQAPAGGTAFVGTTVLSSKSLAVQADQDGHVYINYQTPPSYPNSGCDVIVALNASTFSASSVRAHDPFCFSPITSIGFTPRPIAPAGQLAPNSHVTVTVTVFGSNGSLLSGGSVWLSFHPTTGGGSASVNGVALTRNAQSFTTNSQGQVFVAYTTPGTLPSAGSDRLEASNNAINGSINALDPYHY